MSAIVEIQNIRFGYDSHKTVLDDISAEIYSGQHITLLGPNGVGKSTLLNCIVGLLSPQTGRLLLNGREISGMSRKEIARHIAYVPQKTDVSFDYSVIEFVVMGRTAHMGILSIPCAEDYDRAEEALEKLDIHALKDRPISELSGGEQQKVCIARALVQDPNLIILDEPTSALDYGNQIKVLRLVKQLSESGYAVLITTHNPEHPLLLNSDVWLLGKDGRFSVGSVEEMVTEKRLTELYDTQLCITHVDKINRKACMICSL